ncbi:MAG: LytR family transcriptional regulator [Acidimicrobiia bacterium]|nr:LytR family transcriptional regulator [Acidimicrobiia bacterium]MYC58131.1 LytR family transcriptional regulator [Acidimicrobiia bacterium]MYG94379.1 LytR family transcriptional regulator [Acidimicrobiia bacterium]MYI30563.1 LytR family transcriptional regulator [Acidimicrobiia bacterium]
MDSNLRHFLASQRAAGGGFWRVGWPLLLLALAIAVPLLVWVGWTAIFNSSDGTNVSQELDRSQPGFQAFVEPTPTLLLIHGDPERLHSLAFLALTDAGTEGAVLLIAPETITATGSLRTVWVQSGSDGVASAMVELLGTIPGEVQVVDDAGWAALVAATVPVRVHNPDPLIAANGEVAFSSGMTLLSSADVGLYLQWRNSQESPLAAMFRQATFWEAWLAQVSVALGSEPGDALVIPGEVDRGIGRFVPTLALGQSRVLALPGALDANGAISLDAQAVTDLIREVVPFQIATANTSAPRVRLLNGSGDLSRADAAVRILSRAEVDITVVGNAGQFGWPTTRIGYHDVAYAAAAESLRAALGVGTVVAEEATELEIDITVVLGNDFVSSVATQG